jgi:hypothetical protein
VPAFEGLINTLKNMQRSHFSAYNIIQPGIEKLQEYQEQIVDIEAYILAIGKFSVSPIL